jgi:biopolymer transport protein ExbD
MAAGRPKKLREAGLNITSMMDMFTIVLVFLLKNFEAEGNLLTQADNLKLPTSVSKKTVKEISLTVVVDNEQILVDSKPVLSTADVLASETVLINPIKDEFEKLREMELKAALLTGKDTDEEEGGKVVIQIDKNIPYDVMYKVMATAGASGYSNISFAVIQKLAE